MTTERDVDLCRHPRWQCSDLGKPLPESPHAVSVAMPLWEQVIAYEEGDTAVTEAISLGYPRFVIHPYVRRLFGKCEERFAAADEGCYAFPSRAVAIRCADFLHDEEGAESRIDAFGDTGIHALTFPEAFRDTVHRFWRHFGDIVSSRQAQALLDGRSAPNDAAQTKQTLRKRIAGHAGARPENVYLHTSGMAALAEALALTQSIRPRAKSVQLGFPYVDVLKIQQVRGPGVHFFLHGYDTDLAALGRLLANEPLSAVVCEFPGNPLLQGEDIPRLSALTRAHGVPLIVDDTPATFANVDLLPYADIIISSLTKAFSGVGDVMAGSIVLNAESPLHDALSGALKDLHEDLFWGEDAAALERNSRDFIERMGRVNETTETLCDALREHPAIDRVYYPKFEMPEQYARLKKEGGGYGGLFSLLLCEAETKSQPFYDALRVSKGPSLGNNFTIACPYTLLAHYDELDWAESAGISRYLVRISVGLEDADDLRGRFQEALQSVM